MTQQLSTDQIFHQSTFDRQCESDKHHSAENKSATMRVCIMYGLGWLKTMQYPRKTKNRVANCHLMYKCSTFAVHLEEDSHDRNTIQIQIGTIASCTHRQEAATLNSALSQDRVRRQAAGRQAAGGREGGRKILGIAPRLATWRASFARVVRARR